MQEIIEYYGMTLLAIIEVLGAMGIVCSCIRNGGMLYQMVEVYMNSIGG